MEIIFLEFLNFFPSVNFFFPMNVEPNGKISGEKWKKITGKLSFFFLYVGRSLKKKSFAGRNFVFVRLIFLRFFL